MEISQINLPRTVVQSEDLINSVNDVLSKYYMNIILQLDLNLPIHDLDLMIGDEPKKMQLEKVFKCEIDSGLWDKALVTAVADITHKTCPHVFVVQSIVNYALNIYVTTDLAGVIDFFSRLVMFHPPVTPQAKEYYHSILHEKYIQLHEKKPEELNLFWCLIDILLTCTENKEDLADFDSVTLTSLAQSLPERIKQLSNLFYENGNKKIDYKNEDKSIIYFDELPNKEKVKRCLVVLNFVYEILQAEFYYWFKTKDLMLVPFDKNNQLLLASLIWDDLRDVGFLNNNVKKILKLQHNLKLCEESPAFWVVDRLVALIAEIMRFTDAIEDKSYPFLGDNSNALAREISFYVLDRLKEFRKEGKDVCDLTIRIKPTWLRLLIITYLLSVITGNPCSPELTSVVYILEHIADLKSSKENNEISVRRRSNPKADTKLVEKFQKLPSVNSKFLNGRTRLQTACAKNNVDEVRALLTFPVLEINATDNDGLTALHHACYKGNTSCVQELLSYWPQLGEVQRPVDTRIHGRDGFTPLMCAVVEGHSEVCRLLLEHTGSVLLEDINDDNKTALELSKSAEVTQVLRHYKVNKKTTEHSKKKMHFSEENVDAVLEFAFQLVQGYLSVHRTWDVYHSLKSKTRLSQVSHNQPMDADFIQPDLGVMKRSNIKFCYLRYHRDLKTNIDKLRKITTRVKDIPEFRDFVEPLICILSLNKYYSA